MNDPEQMERDIELLVDQVKELRKQRADLSRRLSEREQDLAVNQFPLSEVSRLAGSIVHDMRNGLGVIRTTVSFLENDLADETHVKDLLKIRYSLEFCELVLRNLSALSGQDLFQPERVNIEEIIREVYLVLERKLVDVELRMTIAQDTSEIIADRGQMKQVFMNLIKNAGEAMPDGGSLSFYAQQEDDMLRLEVKDTGQGISPENKDRLFQEFFTTKPQGYGLGLHIVHTIVKRHGGSINVESELGKGTTFILRLPIE